MNENNENHENTLPKPYPIFVSMKTPHIVLLGPTFPYRGGNALFMTFLYEALEERHRIDFINFRMMYPAILFPGTTPYDVSEEHFQKVPSLRLMHSLNPVSWWQTARAINRLDPDIIAFDWFQPFFGPMFYGIGFFLNRRMKQRILFITENVISHESRWIDKWLTRLGLTWAKAFLTLSRKVEEDIRQLAGSRPVFRSELPIYGWYSRSEDSRIPPARGSFDLNEQDKVLLFFGYIRHYKGLDILLEALAILLKKDPSYRLLVAGESYEDEARYLQLIDTLGIQNQVRFRNEFIPNEGVAPYFEACDVVVLPYRSATQSGILNMAYGFEKPVVITDVGGLGEFVDEGRTGIVVSEPTPEAVAAGILDFESRRASTDFAQHIRERVAGNSFNQIQDVFMEVHELFH